MPARARKATEAELDRLSGIRIQAGPAESADLVNGWMKFPEFIDDILQMPNTGFLLFDCRKATSLPYGVLFKITGSREVTSLCWIKLRDLRRWDAKSEALFAELFGRFFHHKIQEKEVRDDIQLVRLFLSQFKDSAGNSYQLAERPDMVERNVPAIEAIAVNAHGHRLAVEHTLIQPFEGQKSDDLPFLKGFERLRLDDSLRVPDRLIEVIPRAFAIPKGFEWDAVGQKVYDWFKDARLTFTDGESWHTIPDLPFKLYVLVQTMEITGTEGVVSVSRIFPKDKPFIDVLRTAFARKLPKLVATPADKHILLLEDASSAIGFRRVIDGIDACREEFPQLSGVDEIWIAKTTVWKTAGDVWFCHIWPGGVQERFRVQR